MSSRAATKQKVQPRKRPRPSGEAGVSLEAIQKATGKPWAHWTRVLDRFDVRGNGHKAAAKHLLAEHGASPWWSQMLTVRYELEHGLRQPLQRSNKTFAVTVQRTMNATLAAAWKAWTSRAVAAEWLPGLKTLDARPGGRIAPLLGGVGEFTRVDRHDRLRIAWRRKPGGPGGTIEVRFTPKPDGRVTVGGGRVTVGGGRVTVGGRRVTVGVGRVTVGVGRVTVGVGHSGIAGKQEAEQLKKRWTAYCDAMRRVVDGA